MPEIRRDALHGRFVLLSPERAKRPSDFAMPCHGGGPIRPARHTHRAAGAPHRLPDCPFCGGNEDRTPPALLALRVDGSETADRDWSVRVVPNKYPALIPGRDGDPESLGTHDSVLGAGMHEVVVETPDHVRSIAALDAEQMARVLDAYAARLRAAALDPGIAYGLIFKNAGAGAGASLEHVHTQFLGLPFVPAAVADEVRRFEVHGRERGTCLLCDLVAEEERAADRIIASAGGFLAYAPYASRLPYELAVAPRDHAPRFEETPARALADLAGLLKQVLGALDRIFADLSYNYFIHTAPYRGGAASFHWHLEIIPRLSGIGGFELGTGCFINSVPPEKAAARLRQAAGGAGASGP